MDQNPAALPNTEQEWREETKRDFTSRPTWQNRLTPLTAQSPKMLLASVAITSWWLRYLGQLQSTGVAGFDQMQRLKPEGQIRAF